MVEVFVHGACGVLWFQIWRSGWEGAGKMVVSPGKTGVGLVSGLCGLSLAGFGAVLG